MEWREFCLLLLRRGMHRMPHRAVLRRALLPLLLHLGNVLSVPYVVAHGVLPALGTDACTQRIAYRYGFAAMLALTWIAKLVLVGLRQLARLHNEIRDEMYLEGRRLHNVDELSE